MNEDERVMVTHMPTKPTAHKGILMPVTISSLDAAVENAVSVTAKRNADAETKSDG